MMAVRRPKMFKLLSSKAQKLLRKFLEPRREKRPAGLKDLGKYMNEKWLSKTVSDKNGKFDLDLMLFEEKPRNFTN